MLNTKKKALTTGKVAKATSGHETAPISKAVPGAATTIEQQAIIREGFNLLISINPERALLKGRADEKAYALRRVYDHGTEFYFTLPPKATFYQVEPTAFREIFEQVFIPVGNNEHWQWFKAYRILVHNMTQLFVDMFECKDKEVVPYRPLNAMLNLYWLYDFYERCFDENLLTGRYDTLFQERFCECICTDIKVFLENVVHGIAIITEYMMPHNGIELDHYLKTHVLLLEFARECGIAINNLKNEL